MYVCTTHTYIYIYVYRLAPAPGTTYDGVAGWGGMLINVHVN